MELDILMLPLRESAKRTQRDVHAVLRGLPWMRRRASPQGCGFPALPPMHPRGCVGPLRLSARRTGRIGFLLRRGAGAGCSAYQQSPPRVTRRVPPHRGRCRMTPADDPPLVGGPQSARGTGLSLATQERISASMAPMALLQRHTGARVRLTGRILAGATVSGPVLPALCPPVDRYECGFVSFQAHRRELPCELSRIPHKGGVRIYRTARTAQHGGEIGTAALSEPASVAARLPVSPNLWSPLLD